jgi:Uma2 family endonuclease
MHVPAPRIVSFTRTPPVYRFVGMAAEPTVSRRRFTRAEYYRMAEVATETVEIFRDPGADGYRQVARAAGSASVRPQAFSDVEVTLAEIFA